MTLQQGTITQHIDSKHEGCRSTRPTFGWIYQDNLWTLTLKETCSTDSNIMQPTANLWLWCHHLTVVQISAYLWLCLDYGVQGVYGSSATTLPRFRVRVVLQQHSKTMTLKPKVALSKPLPSRSTCTTAIVCEIRSSAIYWYFPLCCWQLSSQCVSINVLDSPLFKPHLMLQYWAKCLHNHIIRIIGSVQNVVVYLWRGNGLQSWCIYKSAHWQLIMLMHLPLIDSLVFV